MTENFGELLEKRKKSAIAVFHRFRLEVGTGTKNFLFVEGYDDKLFYSSFLPSGSFDSSSIRIAFGKKNMDQIIIWFYSEKFNERCNAAFIRDADFDRHLGMLPSGSSVVVLDRYSVENFVFTPDALRRLILERFGISESEYRMDDCIKFYKIAVEEIFLSLSPLIGAALISIKNDRSVDLEGLDIRSIIKFYFKNGKPKVLDDSDYENCKISSEFVNEEARRQGLEFTKGDPFLWIRGRYLGEICSIFVRKTYDDLCFLRKNGDITNFNRSISSDFSRPSLFERMSNLCAKPNFIDDL